MGAQWFTLFTAQGVRIGKIFATRDALRVALGDRLAFDRECVTLISRP